MPTFLVDSLRRGGIHPSASGRIAEWAANERNVFPVIVRREGVMDRGAGRRHLVHGHPDACTRRLIYESGTLESLSLGVLRFRNVEFPGADRLGERRASESDR